MNKDHSAIAIGNVLRADIRSFVVASHIPEPQVPTFGTFVKAPIQRGEGELIGLVYDIRLQDDPFLRNLAVTLDEANPEHREVIADQQERVIPVEISVAAVGYLDSAGTLHYGLPPQPPMVLRQITVCPPEEVAGIVTRPEWIQPLLDNREVPADALITRRLQRNAARLPAGEPQARESYLLETARYLARRLAHDPLRLETILRQLVE